MLLQQAEEDETTTDVKEPLGTVIDYINYSVRYTRHYHSYHLLADIVAVLRAPPLVLLLLGCCAYKTNRKRAVRLHVT